MITIRKAYKNKFGKIIYTKNIILAEDYFSSPDVNDPEFDEVWLQIIDKDDVIDELHILD